MRIAVGVEYDGSAYCGWQRQSHSESVQQEVETALSKIADCNIIVHCAGRTDTAVHAQGQVIHFDTEVIRPKHSWLLGGNTYLPDNISLQWVKFVDDTFHARFSAFSRRYRYVILNRKIRSSLLAGRVVNIHEQLDADLMHRAAQLLLGKNDFSSFRAQGCQAKSPVRNMISINVSRRGDFITLDVLANAFLLHMVRNIVGSLMMVGHRKKRPEWIQELLELKDRTQAGVTAPPEGLYLVSVGYPETYELPQPPNPIEFG
ncbi:MAG TPA: tRNA pseudouridine(38-40) synthase TruA [Gammaproteobacteria bacterium]|nr:tRNA pseudouridine(38-40) synthase TruA [Gammaproteobacteria bacterium]